MNIIKLNATESTNEALKALQREMPLDDFTILHTLNQTKGKGQRGNTWISQSGKNLTFSILIRNKINPDITPFDFNILICTSVHRALMDYNLPELKIKWPNDILAGDKKIGGILIENTFGADQSINSVVGIGINVNQTEFGPYTSASSLALLMNKDFSIDRLLDTIAEQIIHHTQKIKPDNKAEYWEYYHKYLFLKGIPTEFKTPENTSVYGTIQRVLPNGKLQIQDLHDQLIEFDLKEIQQPY